MSVLPQRCWVCRKAVRKEVPAITVDAVPPRSTATTVNRHAPSQVTPSCQPWRCQRVTQNIPPSLGKHDPPPRTLQHQLSTAVAKLLQRQRVRVKQHLQVGVQAHQLHLRARHEREWDERHAGQGMLHRSVAEAIEEDRARSAALAAAGSNAFCVMMRAAPKQRTSRPRTLQAFVDGHWQLRFTIAGGVMCICCAWAAQTHSLGVKQPPKAAAAFVNGTYVMGMRMMIAGPKTWRKDVLEGHLGVSRGTSTSARKLTIRAATT